MAALRNYLGGGGEAALQQAYSIGRTALDAGAGVIELVGVHHAALRSLLSPEFGTDERRKVLADAALFFAESIAPYEMTYGGFREANMALRHFNEVLELEAKRIAHALHGEAGQLLVAVYIALDQMTQEVPSAKSHVLAVTQLLDKIEEQLRRLSHELAPALLNDLGLVPALRYLADGLAQRSGLRVNIEDVPEGSLPKRVETTLYHVAKEALHNVTKHARAEEVTIRFERWPHGVRCFLQDDGVGFEPTKIQDDHAEKGFGLIGMRERLKVVGGQLRINSLSGHGTELVVEIPLEE